MRGENSSLTLLLFISLPFLHPSITHFLTFGSKCSSLSHFFSFSIRASWWICLHEHRSEMWHFSLLCSFLWRICLSFQSCGWCNWLFDWLFSFSYWIFLDMACHLVSPSLIYPLYTRQQLYPAISAHYSHTRIRLLKVRPDLNKERKKKNKHKKWKRWCERTRNANKWWWWRPSKRVGGKSEKSREEAGNSSKELIRLLSSLKDGRREERGSAKIGEERDGRENIETHASHRLRMTRHRENDAFLSFSHPSSELLVPLGIARKSIRNSNDVQD